MANLGTAYVSIVPSTGGLGKSVADSMNAAAKPAGQSAGGFIAGGIKSMIAAGGIGLALKTAFTEGAALEQSLGGVETLYKNSSDRVIKNANNAWKTAGLSANEYMEQSTSFAAALVKSLGGDTEAAAKAADTAIIDMADNAAKMGTPMEQIQSAYQGFAKGQYMLLDNLKLGYGGTKGEMERLLADAEKLTGQKYDINNLSDVYEAIHAIQGELDITGTTAKEGAATLTGSLMAMLASVKNVLGAIVTGKGLDSALMGLLDSVSSFAFNNLLPAILRIVKQLPKLLTTVIRDGVPMILKGVAQAIPQIFNALTTFVNQWAKRFPKLLDQLGTNPQTQSAGVKIAKRIAMGLIKGIPQLVAALAKMAVAVAGAWARNLPRFAAMGLKAAASLASKFKNSVKSKILGIFPLKVGRILSGIKLPKLKVTSGKAPWGFGGKGKEPQFKIKWNAEGGIFDSASIIGYGVGEKGAEAIVPLTTFWQKMDAIAGAVQGSNAGGVVNLVINLDGQTIGQSAVSYINGQTVQFNASPLIL